MESSCFVASKSFGHALFPSRRRRNCGGGGFASTAAAPRCSLRDDPAPALDSRDWRSFRAKLVAGELAAEPVRGSAWADPGDWWAHPLHEPEKGCLLVATERLDGVHIFERAVVLLLSAGPVGPPTGVILNRPSLMSIKEVGTVAATDAAGAFSGRPLFFGGPLEEGVFLVRGGGGAAGSGVLGEVMEGMYYGTKESVGCAGEMVKSGVVSAGDFRFFDGHCGWDGPQQLREEVQAGYWAVAACSASVVEMDSARLWEDIVGLVWGKKRVR